MENTEQQVLRPNPKINVTTNLDLKIWEIAKVNQVVLNKALTFGIYAELINKKVMDITDLPANLNYFTQEIARLKNKLKETVDNGKSV